jgi:hypothetical protein
MPSGRDSFRRNRVAPFVLSYFTTLRVGGALAGRFVDFLNRRNMYRPVLEPAFHADVLRRESSSGRLRLKNIHAIPNPQPIFRAFSHTSNNAFLVRRHVFGDLAVCPAMGIGHIPPAKVGWNCRFGKQAADGVKEPCQP